MNDRRRWALLGAGAALLAFLALRNGSISAQTIYFFGALVPSVILHEVSHGAFALLFGDDTAKRAGRLTLNPIPHVDPAWTLIIPGLLAFVGAPVLGMAKPVPVSPRRMRHPRNHSLIVALGGPATNLAISAAAVALLRNLRPEFGTVTFMLLNAFAVVNVYLAVFNLLPIPPLDGSAVVERLVPARHLTSYFKVAKYAPVVFLVLFFIGGGVLSRIMTPAVELWFRIIT